MKQLLLCLALLLAICPVRAQWVMQGLGYEIPDISTKRIDVVDQSIVWTSNNDYGINPPMKYFSRTQNGGASWNPGQITIFPNYCIYDFSAVNFQTAWFLLMNNDTYKNWLILRTTDGGLNWQQQLTPLPDSTNFGCVHFWNSNEGVYFASKPKSRFYAAVTANGGSTWTEVDSAYLPLPIAYGLNNSETCSDYSVAGDNIWIATKRGRVLRSIDKGLHWTSYNTTFTTPGLYNVRFNDLNHGLFYKSNANPSPIAESLNGGLTWSNFTPAGPHFKEGLCWIPQLNNLCVSVGEENLGVWTCSYSFDAGHNWTAWDTLTSTHLFNTDWANVSCGWAGSITTLPGPYTTGIYKFTGTLLDILSIDPKFGGVKMYPNPTRGLTKMVIIGFERKTVALNIFNCLGQKVYSDKFDQESVQSEHQLDLSCLPNGTYLTTATCSGKILHSKIIIDR